MKCTIGVQEKFKDTKGVSRRRQSQNDRTMTKRTRTDRNKN